MVDSHGEEEEEVDKVTDLVDLPADTCFFVNDRRTTPRAIFNNSCKKWTDKEGTYMFTAAQAEKARNDLAYEQFGGRPFNGLDWRPTAFKYRAGSKSHRRLLRCGFNHACGCEYVVEEVWDNDSGYRWFREGLIPHNDHNQVLKGLMGVPPQIKAALNSPSVLCLKPEQFINRIEAKGLFTMDSSLKRKTKHYFGKCVKDNGSAHLQCADVDTYGALAKTLIAFRRENIPKREFTKHTVYLAGDKFCLNSQVKNTMQYSVLKIFYLTDIASCAWEQTCSLRSTQATGTL